MNITDVFIDSIYSFQPQKIPEKIFLQAKKALLDYIGVTLAGATIMRQKNDSFLNLFPAGKEESCSVIGFDKKSSIYNAIIINGFNSHITELDDGHRLGMLHLGSPIISSLLSVAEYNKLEGEKLLRGIIAGYEAAILIAKAMQPDHKQRGYHTTGTCGTIGAAIGIATALSYNKSQLKASLSSAATCAGGLLEIQEDGSELKPYNASQAALNGLSAALIGKFGLISPDDILGGKRGLFAVLSNKENAQKLLERVNDYEIENIYFKSHASCRHTHGPIDTAKMIIENNNISINDIKSIHIETYRAAIIGHDHKEVKGIASAKMSIPFSVALAIAKGHAGMTDFNNTNLVDPTILSLCDLISITENKEFTDLAPSKRISKMEITTYSNKRYNRHVEYAKGEPENPLSKNEFENKFDSLCLFAGKEKEKSSVIKDIIWSLEERIENLYELL